MAKEKKAEKYYNFDMAPSMDDAPGYDDSIIHKASPERQKKLLDLCKGDREKFYRYWRYYPEV